MANKHGDFIWYELMTSDADGAREFYSAVVDWDIEANPSGDFSMVGMDPHGAPFGLVGPKT
jgi:uncharacterized protein